VTESEVLEQVEVDEEWEWDEPWHLVPPWQISLARAGAPKVRAVCGLWLWTDRRAGGEQVVGPPCDSCVTIANQRWPGWYL
jgi:hypothetical protein